MTQTNSRARVKKDTVGEDGMKFLFSQYQSATLESFRIICKEYLLMMLGLFYRDFDCP